MKTWKKASLLTTLLILVLLTGILYFFNISLSVPSADIKFSPGQPTSKINAEADDEIPGNIIIFIADGMGFGHLSIALQGLQEENNPSVWQRFEVKGWHDTRSIYGALTDSEASATAMATGTSTQFGHIGIDPDGNLLENVFELASEMGFETGIVTDSYIWDGTPAAFSAHVRNEDDARSIMQQQAASELDLLFGELEDLGEDDIPEKDETHEILGQRFLILNKSLELPVDENASDPVAVVFDEDEIQDMDSSPNLTRLTEVALNYLSSQEKPFILLVESEEMDAASHENDSRRVINGLVSIQKTLEKVMDFSDHDNKTLVLFTADHETGGLAAVSDFNRYPDLQLKWSTKAHTAAVVPLFALGPGAELFADVHRNREIGQLLKSLVIRDNDELSGSSGNEYACIKYILETDSALGEIRNHNSKNISLSRSITEYTNVLLALNYSECPAEFSNAFKAHIQAWTDVKRITDNYPALRGELHDIFNSIEKTRDSVEFKALVKNIWDTWTLVEGYSQ